MSLIDIEKLRVAPDGSIRDAISTIDSGGQQIALVLDSGGHLLGVVTDGDVRRGLLKGMTLEAPVAEAMNAAPKVASVDEPTKDVLERMAQLSLHHMPIVGGDGTVLGVLTGSDHPRSRAVTTPVVLMAGGRGQRLYPLTKEVPKPMLPIGDIPLLEIILRNLMAQGFLNVHISVNYLAEVIVDFVGDGSRFGLNVSYIYEDKPLGTAGAIAQLHGTITEPFVVMNSDLLTHVDLRRLLTFHRRQKAKATVGVREHAFEIPYGVVRLDGSTIVSMEEKPLHRSLVNAGIYALDPIALSLLKPNEYSDMPSLLGLMMQEGHVLSAFPIHEQWLDVGRPEDLSEARNDSSRWAQS